MNEIVKIHNDLTNDKLGKMNSAELDLFMCICCKMRDKGLQEVVITFSELRQLSCFKKNSNEILVNELIKVNSKLLEFQFVLEKGSKFYHRTLFKEFITDVSECTLTVSVWEETRYILNDLSSNFNRFELGEFVNLDSKYSKRLYKILKQFRTQGFYFANKDEFYKVMDVPESYKNPDFNKRVLKPALEECKKYIKGLSVDVVKTGRGAAVKAYIFKFDAENVPDPEDTGRKKTKTDKNKFNNFQQQNYDFDDLERAILDN